jgi:hypothetical protein
MTDLQVLVAAPGPSACEYRDQAFPETPLTLYAARPVRWDPDTPVLFVHHGVGRNGRDYRDYWLPFVDEIGVLAIAIEFSEAGFPDHLRYHFGNLHNEDGGLNPRERWTYGIPERLFGTLQATGVTRHPRYGLFGHSAGGQFVHRMLSFGYRGRVAVAIAANAGTYAMPDFETPWPFGLGQTDLDEQALRRLLEFPLTIMAGTNDTRTTGRFFPNGPRSMKQGPTRHARAHAYVRLGRSAAERLGSACAWRVLDVPDVGHDGRRMSEAAVPIVFSGLGR